MNAARLGPLRTQWNGTLSALGVAVEQGSAAFDELVKAYTSAGRYYHNLDHIEAILTTIDSLGDEAHHFPVVQLAVWYHDAIYDPRAGDNEERSAVLAETTCAAWGIPDEMRVTLGRLIRATKTHQAEDNDVDALILNDSDLAILGAEQSDYDAYAAAIRREYAWVSEDDYRRGRTRVLQSFLQRHRLFRLDRMYHRCEAQARSNLTREIALLSS